MDGQDTENECEGRIAKQFTGKRLLFDGALIHAEGICMPVMSCHLHAK